MIFEICAIVATIAFVILVIFLIRTLRSSKQSLDQLDQLLKKIDSQVVPLSVETTLLIRNSHQAVESLQEKLDQFDPLLHSISHLGEMIDDTRERVHRKINEASSPKKGQWQDYIADIIQLAAVGIISWNQIKKGRKHED